MRATYATKFLVSSGGDFALLFAWAQPLFPQCPHAVYPRVALTKNRPQRARVSIILELKAAHEVISESHQGRFAAAMRGRRGLRPETFEFLGFPQHPWKSLPIS